MYMLGIETAGTTASVGISKSGKLVAEYLLNNTRTHSQTIMPLCQRLMEDLAIAPKELSAIAVDIGPGSFTGVRIGVCAANAMGAALDIPVVGVPSLAALYQGLLASERPVCVLLDARNQNIYGALYHDNACLLEPEATELSNFLEKLPQQEILFVGDGVRAYEAVIKEKLPDAVFAPEQFDTLRAGYLLSYADEKAKNGFSGEEAAPLYLRPSQAERLFAQRNGK